MLRIGTDELERLTTRRTIIASLASRVHVGISMSYGRILRNLRAAKGRSQADVARSVGVSPAHLARLESGQRGLYLADFISIAEVLGEKPGNLLPNDLGAIGHLKPLIDQLASVNPEFLPRLTTIITGLVTFAGEVVPPVVAVQKVPAPKSKPRSSTKRPAR